MQELLELRQGEEPMAKKLGTVALAGGTALALFMSLYASQRILAGQTPFYIKLPSITLPF